MAVQLHIKYTRVCIHVYNVQSKYNIALGRTEEFLLTTIGYEFL